MSNVEVAQRESSTMTIVSIAVASSLILLSVEGVDPLIPSMGMIIAIAGISYRELTVHLYFKNEGNLKGFLQQFFRLLRSGAVRLFQIAPIVIWISVIDLPGFWSYYAVFVLVALTAIEEVRYH